MYSYLKGKIVERGTRQTIIADALGISPKSLGLKLAGKRDFKWDEVCLIQSRFFLISIKTRSSWLTESARVHDYVDMPRLWRKP